jgi:hypothetical protein
MKVLLLLSLFSLAFAGHNVKPIPTDQPKPYEVAEAYQVYATVLPNRWPVTVAHAKKLLIQAETVDYTNCLKPEGDSIATVGAAIKSYEELNQHSWLLGKTLQMDQQYDLIYAAEIKGMFSQGASGWKNFYERYPESGGWTELSAVGFNAEKTVAVFYVGHHCGMLCGGGEFHVLEKKEGTWRPMTWKGSSCSWFS